MKTEEQIKEYIKLVKTYKDEYPKSRETIIKTLEWVLEDTIIEQGKLF